MKTSLLVEQLEPRDLPVALDFSGVLNDIPGMSGRLGKRLLDTNHDRRIGARDVDKIIALVISNVNTVLYPLGLGVDGTGWTIYIGGSHGSILGYTDLMSARVYFQSVVTGYRGLPRIQQRPTLLAQDIANIACHEIGHLLGLSHSGASDLMAQAFSLGGGLRYFSAEEITILR